MIMKKETYFAYALNDWEGCFSENPKGWVDFVCTEKVFETYEDAYNEAKKRIADRVKEYVLKNGSDAGEFIEHEIYTDVPIERIDSLEANEECYLERLVDGNLEELCTIQIVKYEYERKKS